MLLYASPLLICILFTALNYHANSSVEEANKQYIATKPTTGQMIPLSKERNVKTTASRAKTHLSFCSRFYDEYNRAVHVSYSSDDYSTAYLYWPHSGQTRIIKNIPLSAVSLQQIKCGITLRNAKQQKD